MRFGQRLFINDLFAFKFAVPKLQLQPLRQVVCRRTHTARWRLRIWIAFELLRPFTIYQHMPQRFVPARHEIRITRAGRAHAQRAVQFLFGGVFPFDVVRFCCSNGPLGHAKIRVRIM